MPKKEKNNAQKYTLEDSNAKTMVGIHCDGNLKFRYRLNVQEKGYYAFKGTLSLLDPYNQSKVMKICDHEIGKSIPASKQIHVRDAHEGENFQTLIDNEINRVACELKHLYQDQYNQNQMDGKLLHEMTFYEAELAYLKESCRCSDKTASVLKNYCTSIRTFSKALPDVKIGKINKADLNKVISAEKDGKKKLTDLKEFVKFIEGRNKISSGFLTVIEAALSSIPKKDKDPKGNHNQSKTASNSDSLSLEAEDELNRRLLANKNDVRFVAFGQVKGTGLSLSEIATLKMKQVQRYPHNKEIVFLKIKKIFSGSATQDYTFPIFPFEARLLNDYIDGLAETDGEERLDGEKFLFSPDGGANPLDKDEINQCCKTELLRLKFGYADLIGNVDLQKSKGIEILKNTYRTRLKDYCGLTRKEDEGAYTFMLHQSLGNKVQSDHYRGFTGESGREFLLNIVMQDRRFLPQDGVVASGRKKGETYRTKGMRREYLIYKKDHRNAQQAILGMILKPDDIATFRAEHGCEISIEDIELLDVSEEEGPPQNDG